MGGERISHPAHSGEGKGEARGRTELWGEEENEGLGWGRRRGGMGLWEGTKQNKTKTCKGKGRARLSGKELACR